MLHPPCVSRRTLYVCVCMCVFDIAWSPHPPLRPPEVHSPLVQLKGSTFTCVQLRPIFDRGSTHPVYHDVHSVCVCLCVFAIVCSPHPLLRPPDVHSPLI